LPLRLLALTIDADDPVGLSEFWRTVLDWGRVDRPDGVCTLQPQDDTGFLLRFPLADSPNERPHQMHLDLTSTSLEDQQGRVALALSLGATHLDVGQRPEEGHVVLADPEGNEFCVLGPGNRFLAGCPLLGALAGDGTAAVGHFWSAALGWPLVWDQGEETAIQSPHGGPKITWGGPPVLPKHGKNRFHLDLEVARSTEGAEAELAVEVGRLEALGATRVDIGQGEAAHVVLADPDGNEFCLHPAATRP
jgi:catechol 2,3-dioxygenase-like lactoylglutathione lyase family enzyme/predicted enzyme related to lactoylglutathione lyase